MLNFQLILQLYTYGGILLKSFAMRFICTLVLACCSYIMVQPAAHAEFTDVKKDNPVYESVMWAKNEGIFSGYSNGTFKPSEKLTEAQFAKVVFNYFSLEDVSEPFQKSMFVGVENVPHWADAYYNSLASYSTPVRYYSSNDGRNQPVNRGIVALTLTHFIGTPQSLDESIELLMAKGITTGQNQKYKGTNLYRYFGTHNDLTRAQMASFLHRLNKNGLTSIEGSNASAVRQQYNQSNVEKKLNKFSHQANTFPDILQQPLIPDDKFEMLESTGLPYAADIDLDDIESTKGFEKYWNRLDSKSIAILNNYNAQILEMSDTRFELVFDNQHYLSVADIDYVKNGMTFYISYDAFSNEELVYIMNDLAEISMITTNHLQTAKDNNTVILKNDGKQTFTLEGSSNTLSRFSTKKGLTNTGHKPYVGTFFYEFNE